MVGLFFKNIAISNLLLRMDYIIFTFLIQVFFVMLSKPIHFILVYIITVFNISILFCPLLAALIPFVSRKGLAFSISGSVVDKAVIAFFFLIFLVSVLMLAYFFLDFIFGFAVRASLKGCRRFEKVKEFDFLAKIFEQAKIKFGERHVKLYIKESAEVNAYAVASFGRKAVILTSGLIKDYLRNSKNPEDFLRSIRSIIGHEMSHLINKDFLPTYMIIANKNAVNFVSFILKVFFNILSKIVLFIPYGGRFFGLFMNETYSALNFVLNGFNKLIVNNLYEFLRKSISRSSEYRCDRQSAHAFGGANMARSLSFLGESGYFTVFATHPSTKSRMKKVKDIQAKNKVIRPIFMDSISNYLAFLMLFIVCLYFAKQAGVDVMVRYYVRQHDEIHMKMNFLWSLIKGFI